jgi:glucosylglycerate synthase
MAREPLSDDVQAEIARIGSADLAVGFATTGPITAAPAVASAIRMGLDGGSSRHTAVAIHVDHGPSEQPSPLLSEALRGCPVLRIRAAHPFDGVDGRSAWSDGVRFVLEAGVAVGARSIVMLNSEISSMTPEWVRGLSEPVLTNEYALVLPVYQRSRYDGTLTHTLVAPLIRALFGSQLLHPLAEEFGCSGEAADFLLKQDLWATDLGREGLELWMPVAILERGLRIGQAVLGARTVAPPARPAPLGPTVGRVAGTLFELAERFESVWLDIHGSEPVPTFGSPPEPLTTGPAVDTDRMLLGFRQGVRDLLPIWERILAPENLGDVLTLADSGTGQFHFPDGLWARVVYDFLLAYRTRVVHRSHGAQSLAPLYLGRAASLVLETRGQPGSALARHTQAIARVFEEQKPYLVDRWR